MPSDDLTLNVPKRDVIAAAERITLSGNHTAETQIFGNSGERLTAADIRILHAQLDVLALNIPKHRVRKPKYSI